MTDSPAPSPEAEVATQDLRTVRIYQDLAEIESRVALLRDNLERVLPHPWIIERNQHA